MTVSWIILTLSEILSAFRNATHCATKWGKAWHTWALFNTAVMSHYTLRGFANIAAQFVVAAVTGYFHSIACGAHAKGVDDSLQVISESTANLNSAVKRLPCVMLRCHLFVLVAKCLSF